jgi:uncharacterized membrane protein
MKTALWLSVFWVVPLMYWMLANETKFKKNLVLGVTLPQAARQDEAVQREIRSFLRSLRVVCIALLLLIVPCLLPAADRYMMTLWCLWLLAAIVAPYAPYVICRRRLLELKDRRGWTQTRRTAMVNTAALSPSRWLPPWLFLPSVLLCLVPILYDRAMTVMYAAMAVLCLLFWFGYRYLYRNKAEMVDGNTELTKVLSQIRKRNWGSMWLITAYAMAALCLGMSLWTRIPWLGLSLTVLITIALCVAAVCTEMRTRRLQEKLTRDSGADWYVDEDNRWIGGVLYYNPDDSRTMVNSRIGLNSTVNVAHTPGKLVMGFTLLILLALPFFGLWMDRMSTQDINVTIGAEQLEAGSYTVPLDRIAEVELLETLPSDLRRVVGTSVNTLIKGDFSSNQTGRVKALLDPTVGPYLLIRTTDGACYLLGTRDAAATAALYARLAGE